MRKINLLLIAIFSFFIFSSCAQENDLLVNPPAVNESVKIRFLNFSADGADKSLYLDGNLLSGNLPFGSSSDAVKPQADSGFFRIFANGAQIYRKTLLSRFSRNTIYNILAFPSDSSTKSVDTLVIYSNSSLLPSNTHEAFVRLINTTPGKDASFSIALGCPNGEIIADKVIYRGVSSSKGVRPGKTPFSLIRHSGTESEIIGLFEPSDSLMPKKQYSFFVTIGLNGKIGLKYLDETNYKSEGFKNAIELNETTALIRIANFSGSSISAENNGEAVSNVSSGKISAYNNVSACISSSKDKISIKLNGNEASSKEFSLEASGKYSYLVFDGKDSSGAKTYSTELVVVNPVYKYYDLSGKSLIRVVNGSAFAGPITLSLGARTASGKFSIGEILATNVTQNNVSDAIVINSGYAPLSLFNSESPSKLLKASVTNLMPGESYLLVVWDDVNNVQQISVIEDSYESRDIESLNSDAFIQIFNANPYHPSIKVSVGEHLKDAELNYSGSLATVIKLNDDVMLNGAKATVNLKGGKETLLIIAGTKDKIEAFSDNSLPAQSPAYNSYNARFFNAASDAGNLLIKKTEKEDYLNEFNNLSYGSFSGYRSFQLSTKTSFIIYNLEKQILHKANDINLSYRKNHTIIFAGSKEKGYTIILHQQF